MTEPAADGAFVEIDRNKMSRDQVYMLGAKETLEWWIEELQTKARENAPNIGVASVLMEVAARMKISHDACAVDLTRSCVKSGSATMHNAQGNKLDC